MNARNRHQSSVMMHATEQGHLDCVRLLLTVNGIDVNEMNDGGNTALSFAGLRGHTDIVQLLIKHNADVNAVGRLGPHALHNEVKSLKPISVTQQVIY